MLQKLYIRNFILIDELEVDFSSKMNVITGETGAGKSIIIDAVSLLMGERSTAPTPVREDQKIILEGRIKVSDTLKSELLPIFERNDWDWEDELLLRREFTTQGRSRLFVNDSPVRLKDIQAMSPLLIELHQQFDHLSIRSKSFQLEVLDAMAENAPLLHKYQELYSSWAANLKELKERRALQEEQWKKRDYNQYIFDELAEAKLQPNEIEEMDEKMRLLENTESVLQSLNQASYTLSESEENLSQKISELYRDILGASKNLETLTPLAERLKSVELELQDIADTLQDVAQGVELSPEEVEVLSDRLNMANKLLTKHQVRSTEELLAIYEELDTQLQEVSSSDQEIERLTDLSQEQEKQLQEQAQELSKRRKAVSQKITDKLHEVLALIGMEKAQVKIELQPSELNRWGIDDVQFYLDANQTGKYGTLGSAASGGELNRIMLALKSIIAEKVHLPTLIFDEIDSGISGEPARRVGQLMRKLAAEHQVITITHQASIAAQGDKHWYIYKQESDQKGLSTQIKSIADAERAEHIAELIGGKAGGDSALAAAQKLLQDAQ